MGPIIFQVVFIVMLVSLLAYVAYDDRKNVKLREEEDRLEDLKKDAEKRDEDNRAE